MKEEGIQEKQSKKSSKGKLLLFVVLFVLAYMFVFRPLVVSHCQKQAQYPTYSYSPFSSDRTPTGTKINSEEYTNCIEGIDPLQGIRVIILGDK